MNDLGEEYERSARLLRDRLAELRKLLKSCEDPEEVFRIKRRIAELTPMLTQCNQLARYCRNYYAKGYFIGNGPFGRDRGRKPNISPKTKERLSSIGTPSHYGQGTDPVAKNGSRGVSSWREEFYSVSGRKRGKQIDHFKDIL